MPTTPMHPKAVALHGYLSNWRCRQGYGGMTTLTGFVDAPTIAIQFAKDPAFSALDLLSLVGKPDMVIIEQALSALYPFPAQILPVEAMLVKDAIVAALTERGQKRRADVAAYAGLAIFVFVVVVVLTASARRAG